MKIVLNCNQPVRWLEAICDPALHRSFDDWSRRSGRNRQRMFRAIGTVIVLLTVYHLFTTAFVAFERALVATFETVEVAANATTAELEAQQSQ